MRVHRVFADAAIRWSAIACIAGFATFLLWAAFAGLEEGVTAPGQVVVQFDRKQVQHFEGGIVRTLNVAEGQMVQEGDILLELEPVQSESVREETAQELAVQTATIERLIALRAGSDSADFDAVEAIAIAPAVRQEIVEAQTRLFAQQRDAQAARLSVLQSRRTQLEGRVRDLAQQIRATEGALENARQDLALRRDMLAEKYETILNVQRVEREVAGYEGDLSRLIGERNAARENAREVLEEIEQAKADFNERIGEALLEARSRALSARERLSATDDRLSRTVIRAPQSGTVFDLQQKTLGGVVRPGDVILEIVPDTDELVVAVQLSPTDRDVVAPGQSVEAQLTAYKAFNSPRMSGEVVQVSADLKRDEVTGTPYYEARVRLDPSSLDGYENVRIIPGMPVQAFIASGNRRTFFGYVFEPIFSSIRRGIRMN
jgi:HlyD family secretion protein/epimerase transport system membrane fusion protein